MQNTQALPINRRARQSISSMCKILKCPMDCFQICTMSTAIKSGGSSDGTKSIHSFLFFTAGVSWRHRDYSVHLYRLYHIISPTSTETAQMGSCRGLLYWTPIRAYLKTVNMPKQRVFSACCAPFSLAIHKVFPRKNGFIRRKIPRCWSYCRFSDRP